MHGGEFHRPTAAIHAYSPGSESWKHVADLPVALSGSSTVSLPTGELLIAGGTLEDETWNGREDVFCAAIIKGNVLGPTFRSYVVKFP